MAVTRMLLVTQCAFCTFAGHGIAICRHPEAYGHPIQYLGPLPAWCPLPLAPDPKKRGVDVVLEGVKPR